MRAALLLAIAACVSPSRARYLSGGFASLDDSADIDAQCRMRVARTTLEPRERVVVPATSSQMEGVLEVDAGPLGRLRVVARTPMRSVPLAQLEAPPPLPVRGFFFGVDLRAYKKIAFVVDAGGTMCTASPGVVLPIDRTTDQLVAAIAGLPSDTEVVMLGTASGVRELVPASGPDGRRAAMQWTCNLFCSGDTSLAIALLDAFAEQPDVVVVASTDGAALSSGANERYLDVDSQLYFADPERVLDRVGATVPIIAIDLGRGPHLAAIAEKTGGVVVRP